LLEFRPELFDLLFHLSKFVELVLLVQEFLFELTEAFEFVLVGPEFGGEFLQSFQFLFFVAKDFPEPVDFEF